MDFYAFLTIILVTNTCLLSEYECRSVDVENEMDKKVFLCGSKLTSVLKNLCKGKLHENDDKHSNGASFPKRNKITDECCAVQCSLRFLEDNYCKKDTNIRTTTPKTPNIQTTATIAVTNSWWFYPVGVGPWGIE